MRPLTLSEIERNQHRHTEELYRHLVAQQGAAIAEREAEWEARRAAEADDRTPPDPVLDDRDFEIDYSVCEDSWIWDLEGERF